MLQLKKKCGFFKSLSKELLLNTPIKTVSFTVYTASETRSISTTYKKVKAGFDIRSWEVDDGHQKMFYNLFGDTYSAEFTHFDAKEKSYKKYCFITGEKNVLIFLRWLVKNHLLLKQFIFYLEVMDPELFGENFHLESDFLVPFADNPLIFDFFSKIANKTFKLTKSECKTLIFLKQGLSAKGMAKISGNSPRTHQNHLYSIYQKTNCNCRDELLKVINRLLPTNE